MKKAHKIGFLSTLFLLFLVCKVTETRDFRRRPEDNTIPSITVSSDNPEYTKTWASIKNPCDPYKQYQLKHNSLRIKPIKYGFNGTYFQEHMLPTDIIEFRNKSGAVSGTVLSNMAQNFLEEIKVGQRKFTQFTILKDKDFNYNNLSGLIVAKFNNYPFVIKISIEHPHTMVQPLLRSFEAYGMFIIGGNLRHLTNFTRIPNLHRIATMLSYNPFYLRCLDYPRKWYWQPEKNYNLTIVWDCNGYQETMALPSVYATISDFIETEPFQPQADLNRLSMKVATDTGFLIDPHSGNIVIEKGTHTYILLDTEDFRMMVGLDRSMKAKKYIGWYIELVTNSLKTVLFRTKEERLEQSTTL